MAGSNGPRGPGSTWLVEAKTAKCRLVAAKGTSYQSLSWNYSVNTREKFKIVYSFFFSEDKLSNYLEKISDAKSE